MEDGVVIRGLVTKEFIVQVSASEHRIIALSNYGNIYKRVCGDWMKVKDIPFEELNEEK